MSDDFNSKTHETNPNWKFYDPYDTSSAKDAGESSLTFDNTNAIIEIPQGLQHNLWVSNDNKAPRLLQSTSDTDFGIEVKFETQLYASNQSQGIVVQQDSDTFLRFDVYFANNQINLFVAYVNGNQKTVHFTQKIAYSPNYRRVVRSGNQWTYSYSIDGSKWIDAVTFNQPISVKEVGLFASTSGQNPKFLASIDYFKNLADTSFTDKDVWQAPAPIIDTWYQYSLPNAQLGKPGLTQQWLNILGNVFSHITISNFTYQLNNGPVVSIPLGPDTRRLHNPGDFNAEIDSDQLLVGSNRVTLKALDSNGLTTTKVVDIDYSLNNLWPLPYTADWGGISNISSIESIAHVVDGLWKLTPNGIRTSQTGYDRILAIGDMSWKTDYQVTVPITLHSNFKGIGLALGWQGHSGVEEPRIEWPLQSLAWIRGPLSNSTLEIITYGGLKGWEVVQAVQPIKPALVEGQTYLLKAYSEPLGNGTSSFYVKLWPQGDSEPTKWNVSANIPTRDGSVILVAHKVDATFGDVDIDPITSSPDLTSPLISNIKYSVTGNTATITWNTDEHADSTVNFGLDSNYGQQEKSSSSTTSHSVTLTGLSTKTQYHFQVSSTDQSTNQNTAISSDHTFTTTSQQSSLSGMVSDDFNSALDTSVWSFYDPVGDSTVTTTGSQLSISVPQGSNHDLWKNALRAPRIRQIANDSNFEVEIKTSSLLTKKFQGVGIVVEQDHDDLIRFDFFHDGNDTHIFSASFVNGIPTVRLNTVIPTSQPLFMRVKRIDDQWMLFYSTDGSQWITAGTFNHSLAVNSVGIFAGNAGSIPPAFTALVDHFMVDNLPPDTDKNLNKTPPIISNIQISSSDTSATISWETDKPSDSQVNFGLNDNYGSNAQSNDLVTRHTVTLTGLTADKTYHFQISSTDANQNTAIYKDQTFDTATQRVSFSGMVSDSFNSGLDTKIWSFYDPIGDSTLTNTSNQVSISVPKGSNHDLWKNALNAPRIRQLSNDTDFDVEVKFDSILNEKFQANGLIVEQDLNNFLRFDFYYDGSKTHIFSASFVNGIPSVQLNQTIPSSQTLYLFLKRTADQWVLQYSTDGNNWINAVAYQHKLAVKTVGIFAGNAGSDLPSFTSLTDYFIVDNLPSATDSGLDLSPPIINNIHITSSENTATITWNTNEPSDSQVNYGLDNNYDSNVLDNTLKTDHSVTLTGLTENQIYHYEIISQDGSGNVASSVDLTFLTLSSNQSNLLVFDWNQIVTTTNRGFPWDKPPMVSANGDWTSPINYAEGTLFLRAEIKDIPVYQAMKLQFCIWQYSNTLETCTYPENVDGISGNIVTWSIKIDDMWKKDGNDMDWANPRQRHGVAIKNSVGLPVSNYLGWNWNGEDPNAWYPMDLRFTVVAVPKSGTFEGWNHYIHN